jgi:hypothetical protein
MEVVTYSVGIREVCCVIEVFMVYGHKPILTNLAQRGGAL